MLQRYEKKSYFDEVGADGVDGEVDAILRAVVAHTAYPFVVAGTVAAEALAAKVHVLYLPAGKGWRDVFCSVHSWAVRRSTSVM